MTYTVAAICGTNENSINQPVYNLNVTHYVGTGSIMSSNSLDLHLDTTTNHSFGVAGYSTWPQNESSWQGEPTSIIFGSHIAVKNETHVVLNTGLKKVKVFEREILQRQGAVCSLRVSQGNNTTTYEIDAGMEILHRFDENSVNTWTPISLFSDSNDFYMAYIGTGPWERRDDETSIRTRFLGIKKSRDGIQWTNVVESPAYAHDINHFINDFLSNVPDVFRTVSAKVQYNEQILYFFGDKVRGKLIYSDDSLTEWTELSIGRFDGLHWYNDNNSGNMYLCAVRIGDDGCFGTIICDAYGSMYPKSWRRASKYWDWSLTRLDAGYIAGTRQVDRPPVLF